MTETFDLEGVCELEEVVQVSLLDFDLSTIHEEEKISDDFFSSILEDYDWMLLGQIFEEAVEVVRACCQDHPMGGDGLTIGAGEADIHQGVGVQKVLE